MELSRNGSQLSASADQAGEHPAPPQSHDGQVELGPTASPTREAKLLVGVEGDLDAQGERQRVARRHHHPGLAVDDHVAHVADVGRDDGAARAFRLR